jgi:hypothetical protein
MRALTAVFVSAVALGGGVSTGASARAKAPWPGHLPGEPRMGAFAQRAGEQWLGEAAPPIKLVAEGCGWGWHRHHWIARWGHWHLGHCVPNWR